MFVDTNPDPSFVKDESVSLPPNSALRKRSASVSVASTEDWSSGEEEAANLVKKKVKVVPVIPKDAMQANEDYVTLVMSDVDDEEEEDDEESEAESGLEEDHLDSISRKIEPAVYDNQSEAEESHNDDDEDTEEEDDSGSESGSAEDGPDTTLTLKSKIKAQSESDETDDSDDSDD